jgi:hypothetical protein
MEHDKLELARYLWELEVPPPERSPLPHQRKLQSLQLYIRGLQASELADPELVSFLWRVM